MDEKQLDEYRARYYADMRAVSQEEMAAPAISQRQEMRNTTMMSDECMRGMAQITNMWPQFLAAVPADPLPPLTRCQRFNAWFSRHCWW